MLFFVSSPFMFPRQKRISQKMPGIFLGCFREVSSIMFMPSIVLSILGFHIETKKRQAPWITVVAGLFFFRSVPQQITNSTVFPTTKMPCNFVLFIEVEFPKKINPIRYPLSRLPGYSHIDPGSPQYWTHPINHWLWFSGRKTTHFWDNTW